MSDRLDNGENTVSAPSSDTSSEAAPTQVDATAASPEGADALDAMDNIDFLLEEIENKIAPLALA